MKTSIKKAFSIAIALLLAVAASAQADDYTQSFQWPWHWEGNTIVTTTPERPEGQRHVLKLRAPKMDTVRVAFVGLGMRGPDAVERFCNIEGTRVVALCDYHQERAEKCQQILDRHKRPHAAIYSGEEGYKQLCARRDIDLVYIATDWHHHFLVAMEAMGNGLHVAIEVPAAMTLEECWELVNMSEQTRLHCMILENCCYDEFELNSLSMAQQGLFGEVIRVQGAYIHNLDEYWPHYWKADANDNLGWRLRWNKEFRGDIYPTHGLGPIAQVLNIHRGDRMRTLVAMDTRSFNGKALVEHYSGESCNEFANGDHTTTLIRTQLGKVIEIQHCVMTPQPYNRLYQITGTKGFANKYPAEGYVLEPQALHNSGLQPRSDNISTHRFLPEAEHRAVVEKFMSPILRTYADKAHQVGGHGGMDFTMDARLVYCLRNGLPLDMDVYDLAEWCCLAELGHLSMEHGFAPVEVPDFTRGHWNELNGYHHEF